MTQSFTSNPINATSAGGGWDLLDTATASASATIEFTTSIDSTYNVYAFVVDKIIPTTNSNTLVMRTSANAGVSYDSGASNYDTSAAAPATQMVVSAAIGNTSTEGAAGIIYMFDPSATKYCQFSSKITSIASAAGAVNILDSSGARLNTAIVDAVQFYCSTSNMISGTIRMYGCCKPA